MDKTPPKRVPGSLQQPPLRNGSVTVSVVRKHSIRQYETMDVQISVTADVEPDESQHDATMRIFNQLTKDMLATSNKMRDLAKNKDL